MAFTINLYNAKRTLGTQMKATGEVMAMLDIEQAIMKAVRGAEISHDTLNDKEFAELYKRIGL